MSLKNNICLSSFFALVLPIAYLSAPALSYAQETPQDDTVRIGLSAGTSNIRPAQAGVSVNAGGNFSIERRGSPDTDMRVEGDFSLGYATDGQVVGDATDLGSARARLVILKKLSHGISLVGAGIPSAEITQRRIDIAASPLDMLLFPVNFVVVGLHGILLPNGVRYNTGGTQLQAAAIPLGLVANRDGLVANKDGHSEPVFHFYTGLNLELKQEIADILEITARAKAAMTYATEVSRNDDDTAAETLAATQAEQVGLGFYGTAELSAYLKLAENFGIQASAIVSDNVQRYVDEAGDVEVKNAPEMSATATAVAAF